LPVYQDEIRWRRSERATIPIDVPLIIGVANIIIDNALSTGPIFKERFVLEESCGDAVSLASYLVLPRLRRFFGSARKRALALAKDQTLGDGSQTASSCGQPLGRTAGVRRNRRRFIATLS
jgi:hypothetical protein